MARKGARLERAGALTPRDRMWAAMRSLAASGTNVMGEAIGTFSPAEILVLANASAPHPIEPATVDSYVRGLLAAAPQYLELVDGNRPRGRKRSDFFLYRLVRDVGVEAPNVTKDGTPTEPARGNTQMWNAMRTLKEFSVPELAHAASTPEHVVSSGVARNYVRWLAGAGYLTALAAARSTTPARYRFNKQMNTGPRAPLVLRDESVYDANKGETVWTRSKDQNRT